MAPRPELRSSADSLGRRLSGRLHLPGDPGYDAARASANLLVDQKPRIVVEPTTSIDVVRAIGFAGRRGLGVSMIATGHGVAPGDDGQMLIATRRLDGVAVDPRHRTAVVGAGARWAAVAKAAARHGLAPVASTAAHVGAVGSTLGGGVGWLARRHGLAIDRVRAFEIVTPDGELRTATPSMNPALFWALCGAGAGTFGVVTAMEIELVPCLEVAAGTLWYHGDLAAEVFERWTNRIATAPDALTSSVALVNFPPTCHVPNDLGGRPMVAVRACHADNPSDGMSWFRSWRDWRTPAHDDVGIVPFRATESLTIDAPGPTRALMTAEWLTRPDPAVVEAVQPLTFAPPIGSTVAEIMHVGGAATRSTTGCFPSRRESLLLRAVTTVARAEHVQTVAARLARLRNALGPVTSGLTQLDLCSPAERAIRVTSTFDEETMDRLRRVRSMLDTEHLLDRGLLLGMR